MFWKNKLLKKENIRNKHLILDRDSNATSTINEINNNQLINKNLVLNNNQNNNSISALRQQSAEIDTNKSVNCPNTQIAKNINNGQLIIHKPNIFGSQKIFHNAKEFQEVDIERREFFKKAMKVGVLAGVGALLAKPVLAGLVLRTDGVDRLTIDDNGNIWPTASGSQVGVLSSTDWTTFNNKVATSLSISTTAPLAGGGDLSASRTLSIPVSSGSADGYLSSTNWTTFNNKARMAIGTYTHGGGGWNTEVITVGWPVKYVAVWHNGASGGIGSNKSETTDDGDSRCFRHLSASHDISSATNTFGVITLTSTGFSVIGYGGYINFWLAIG